MLVYQARNILTNKVYVGKTTRTLAHAKSRHKNRATEAIRKAHKDKPKIDEHKQKLSIAKKRISRFTQDDYDNIVKMRLEGSTYKEIGSAFNAHPSVVRKIFKRETTSNMR